MYTWTHVHQVDAASEVFMEASNGCGGTMAPEPATCMSRNVPRVDTASKMSREACNGGGGPTSKSLAMTCKALA